MSLIDMFMLPDNKLPTEYPLRKALRIYVKQFFVFLDSVIVGLVLIGSMFFIAKGEIWVAVTIVALFAHGILDRTIRRAWKAVRAADAAVREADAAAREARAAAREVRAVATEAATEADVAATEADAAATEANVTVWKVRKGIKPFTARAAAWEARAAYLEARAAVWEARAAVWEARAATDIAWVAAWNVAINASRSAHKAALVAKIASRAGWEFRIVAKVIDVVRLVRAACFKVTRSVRVARKVDRSVEEEANALKEA